MFSLQAVKGALAGSADGVDKAAAESAAEVHVYPRLGGAAEHLCGASETRVTRHKSHVTRHTSHVNLDPQAARESDDGLNVILYDNRNGRRSSNRSSSRGIG